MIKNIDRWIGSYLKQQWGRAFKTPDIRRPIHIMFCCVDHFEPDWSGAGAEQQRKRVMRWIKEYPLVVKEYQDTDGCHPKHTFFYPAECYVREHLELLSKLCCEDYAEVEVHLHHDGDSEESFRNKLEDAKRNFSQHQLLGKRGLSNQIRFAFIHGNWALNNSRSDGRYCGVNDETRILAEAGCYADFTYPSAPNETQPQKINSIYYVRSNAMNPKTHNTGVAARVGQFAQGDLLMIQGPLTLNWRNRKKGVVPRIENGAITGANPPTQQRVDLWIEQNICVQGKPDWIFVKVHTHGAPERNADALLGKPIEAMHRYLTTKYNDRVNYQMHYVTAREMYNIIKAAEAGERGNPGDYRNYMIQRGGSNGSI